MKITDATVEALIGIRDACKAEGIVASDRRWKKSLRLVQATAWLAGEKQTTPEDLTLLVDALWREPKERTKVAKLVGQLADPVATQALEILDAAKETADKVAGMKAGDRKLYISQAAQALESFTQQMSKLQRLGSRRAGAPRTPSTPPTPTSPRCTRSSRAPSPRVSAFAGCVFHAISITDSTASRSGIPREADHPFHGMPIGHSTHADHPEGVSDSG